MSVMPRDKVGQIAFCTSHVPPWVQNAGAIGATPEMIAELAARTEAARDAYAVQVQAQSAAMTATAAFNRLADEMAELASNVIKHVRARAATDGDEVYVLAMIPSPARPSPINTLDQPHSFSVALDAIGAVTLKWKCTHPRGATGVVYQISRAIVGLSDFVPVGVSGEKKFNDQTIPAGASQLIYMVRAIRSTGASDWATYNVNFGAVSGTRTKVPFVPRNNGKLAA